MSTDAAAMDRVARLFDTPFHNPSMYAVRAGLATDRDLVDFCVPANGYFPPPAMLQAIKDNLAEILKYYPDYSPVHQENISRWVGTPAENIVPANGVTELITSMCALAEGPIATDVPTFGRWTDLPIQQGVPLHCIARRKESDFRLSVDEITTAVEAAGARTLIICNPNNPTGAWLDFNEVEQLIERLSDLALIVVDESFIEFSGLESAERLAMASRNTVVVKSMGKAFGWHGVRLGYGVGNLAMADALRARLPYWNVNGVAGFVLKHALEYRDEYVSSFEKVAQDREYMFDRLSSIDRLRTYPSKANFLLSELPAGVSGKEVRNILLRDHALLVRECSNKLGSSEQFLRNVVRKKPEVDRLAEALRDVLRGHQGA